ncbi:MAG: hypothetical protein SFY56_04275 [Bacteroidota bacterium]|nr:hypothetical protein [Bacteroidota bacterium]
MEFEEPKFTKRELNQSKWIIAFGIFIVTFQLLQYINSKKSSNKFEKLFENNSKIQGYVSEIYSAGTSIQRYNLNLFLSEGEKERNKIINARVISEHNVEKAINKIQLIINEFNGASSLEPYLEFVKLKHNWIEYKSAYNKLKIEDPSRFADYRKNVLRPKYEYFLKSTNSLFNVNIKNQGELTQNISRDTEKKGFYLLIFGNIVLVIILVFLGYIIYFEHYRLKAKA